MDNVFDLTQVIQAAQQGHWFIFAGLVLASLVQVARKVLPGAKKIPKQYLPYIVVGLGVVGAGAAVLVGGGNLVEALNSGIQAAVAALGAYAVAEKPGRWLADMLGGGSVETPKED